MWICTQCKSSDVVIQAWVDINTHEYDEELEDADIVCNQCGSMTVRLETQEEINLRIEATQYLNQVNSKLKF